MTSPPTDPLRLREVLGHYPTGVCVVTSRLEDGSQAGLVVGSFTSVSLNPPLVGFLPAKRSTSWPKMAKVGRFCVNVLSADQQDLCNRIAARSSDKFRDIATRPSAAGSPILDDVLAWIDCEIATVSEAGDHFVVIGRVIELDIEKAGAPLVFHRGGFGQVVMGAQVPL